MRRSKSETTAEVLGVDRATARAYLDENERASPHVGGREVEAAPGSNNCTGLVIRAKVKVTREEYIRLSGIITKKVASSRRISKDNIVSWFLTEELPLAQSTAQHQAAESKKIKAVLKQMQKDKLLGRDDENGRVVLVVLGASQMNDSAFGQCIVLDDSEQETPDPKPPQRSAIKQRLASKRQKPPDVVELDDTQSDEEDAQLVHVATQQQQKPSDVVDLADSKSDEDTQSEPGIINDVDDDDDDDNDAPAPDAVPRIQAVPKLELATDRTNIEDENEALRRVIELSKQDAKPNLSCGSMRRSKSETTAEMLGVDRATARAYLDENERASPHVGGREVEAAPGSNNCTGVAKKVSRNPKPPELKFGKDANKHAETAKRKSEDALNRHRMEMAAKYQRDRQTGNAFASPAAPPQSTLPGAGNRQPSPCTSGTPTLPWMSPAAGQRPHSSVTPHSGQSVTPQQDNKMPQSQFELPKQCECGSYTHKTRNSMQCPLMDPELKRRKLEQQRQRKHEKEEAKKREEEERAREQLRLRQMATQLNAAAEALEPKKKRRKKS